MRGKHARDLDRLHLRAQCTQPEPSRAADEHWREYYQIVHALDRSVRPLWLVALGMLVLACGSEPLDVRPAPTPQVLEPAGGEPPCSDAIMRTTLERYGTEQDDGAWFAPADYVELGAQIAMAQAGGRREYVVLSVSGAEICRSYYWVY